MSFNNYDLLSIYQINIIRDIDGLTINEFRKWLSKNIDRINTEELLNCISYLGKIDFLKHILTYPKIECNTMMVYYAILNNKIEMIKFLDKEGCVTGENYLLNSAAKFSTLEIVKYVHQNFVPNNIYEAYLYAKNKDILNYFEEHMDFLIIEYYNNNYTSYIEIKQST